MKRNLGDIINFPALPGEPVFVVMPDYRIQRATLKQLQATWLQLKDNVIRREITVLVELRLRILECSPEFVFGTLEEAEQKVSEVKATLTKPVKN
jgi:hypothetical protein